MLGWAPVFFLDYKLILVWCATSVSWWWPCWVGPVDCWQREFCNWAPLFLFCDPAFFKIFDTVIFSGASAALLGVLKNNQHACWCSHHKSFFDIPPSFLDGSNAGMGPVNNLLVHYFFMQSSRASPSNLFFVHLLPC